MLAVIGRDAVVGLPKPLPCSGDDDFWRIRMVVSHDGIAVALRERIQVCFFDRACRLIVGPTRVVDDTAIPYIDAVMRVPAA